MDTLMTGKLDYGLVGLSIAIAIVSAATAFDLAARIRAAAARLDRYCWLAGGAIAMGLGIWAMHYVGMLAYKMKMPVRYHLYTVVLSLFAAIGASTIALLTASRENCRKRDIAVGGLFMGCAIAAMHYVGMAAMRIPAKLTYDPRLVGLSIVLVIVISWIALFLTFRVSEEKHTSFRKILSAITMGGGIAAMHYTAMNAAIFAPSDDMPNLAGTVTISLLGGAAIGVGSLLVLMVAILTAFLDRMLAAKRATIVNQKSEERFRTLAEAIPQIIWTAQPDGVVDYYNPQWYQYTGRKTPREGSALWQGAIHPEEESLCMRKWNEATDSGNPYEVEHRFWNSSDHAYRWQLVRAVPMKNENGEIVKWFGTCTDIDEQKRKQEVLRQDVQEQTAALSAANARLLEEMQQREQAQRELDQQTQKMVAELTEGAKRAALLGKMVELLQSSLDTQEAFSIILSFAPRLFPRLKGALILLNGSKDSLEVVGSWANCNVSALVFELSSCWALRTGHVYHVRPGGENPSCVHARDVTSAYICLPIVAQGETMGVLHLQGDNDLAPSDCESSLAATVVEQIGLSLANIKLQDALRTQSTKDPLTGLFNRRYLQDHFERELNRSQRTNLPVSVLMIDVDHFKRFNDTFGHSAGDAVLREIAIQLASGIRIEDLVCRYGGEEFTLILPDTSKESAYERAEELRLRVKDMQVRHHGASLGQLSISIGIATSPEDGSAAQQLLEAADAALYTAKQAGRDRVIAAGKFPNLVLAVPGHEPHRQATGLTKMPGAAVVRHSYRLAQGEKR